MEKSGQDIMAVLQPGNKGPHRSLAKVLDEICLYGKDVLTDALHLERSLKSARLAFKALRDTVDGSIRGLCLRVAADDKQRLEAGQRFPLRRWPRLAQLTVALACGVSGSQVAIHLALPFTGQPAESLKRITDLSLLASHGILTTEGVVALSALLPRFSSLRCLELRTTLAQDPLQQAFLNDALSSLTQLEELTLSGFFVAPQSDSTLYRLKQLHIYTAGDEALGWVTLAAARLRALETVSLEFSAWDNGLGGRLLQLLRRPPPGLRSLHLTFPTYRDSDMVWQLTLVSGVVTEVRQMGEAYLGHITEFGSTVLLPLGRPLDMLHLTKVTLDRDDPQLPDEQPLQQLRGLAQSSRRVRVDKVTFYPGFDSTPGLHAMKRFGVMPGEISFANDEGFERVVFRLKTNMAGSISQATNTTAAPMVAPTERDWAVMGSPELIAMALELLLQRLEAAGSSFTVGSSAIVRLQSPLFSMLAWAPGGLYVWMRHLESQATAAMARHRYHSAFDAYLPILSADTVFVRCISEDVAVAVAAAAHTAGRNGFEGVVQVYPSSTCSIHDLLEEAAQAFWDSGAGGSDWERLRLLLELGFTLMDNNESPVVDLDDSE